MALSKQNPNSVAYSDVIFSTKSGYSTYWKRQLNRHWYKSSNVHHGPEVEKSQELRYIGLTNRFN